MSSRHLEFDSDVIQGVVGMASSSDSNQTAGEGARYESSPQWFIVFRSCLISFICLPTIVGNCLSIIVTRLVPTLADTTKVLMTSLAACDLIIGILGIWHVVASVLDYWPFGPEFCTFHAVVSVFSVNMSIVFITLLNGERYVAVTRPFLFQHVFTRRRAVIVSAVSSLACLAAVTVFVTVAEQPVVSHGAAISCNFDFDNVFMRVFILCAWVVVPLTTISIMYWQLIRISRRHARQIRDQPSTTSTTANASHGDGACEPAGPPVPRRQGSDWKAMRTFLIVTLVFAVCWTPYTVSGAYAAIAATTLPEWLEFAAFWLAASNSFLDVFIYCLFNRSFRQTAKRLASERLRCGHRSTSS